MTSVMVLSVAVVLAQDFGAFDKRVTDLEKRVAALEAKTVPAQVAAGECPCGPNCPCPDCPCKRVGGAATTTVMQCANSVCTPVTVPAVGQTYYYSGGDAGGSCASGSCGSSGGYSAGSQTTERRGLFRGLFRGGRCRGGGCG